MRWVQFDAELMLQPGKLKPERLAACPGADLYRPVLRHRDLLHG